MKALNFEGKYFVDADHINLKTVAPYVEVSDFFTLDVASFIGKESKHPGLFAISIKPITGQEDTAVEEVVSVFFYNTFLTV